jgi:hypothetical protein
MTLREAVANLIKVKGRHNTEIAYQKLVEAFDADKPIYCGCGDQIMPNDGAECGNCVTARNAVKEWVGLTPEEAREISLANRPYVVDMIAALEARLKEKNT